MYFYLEDGYEKPFDCPIIQLLLNAFESIGSHFLHQNNLPRDMVSLPILCAYISASQTGTNRFFMVI